MGRVRLLLAACGALIALACVATSAQAASPADWLYEPTTFTEVHLTLPPKSIAKLEEEPKKYVHGTFSLAETDGGPGTAGPFGEPIEVGVELKGNYGSLRTINQKAAFKIDFGKYVEGQRFLGLEKLTLNNMIQDPSNIHEVTAYAAFHAMGVPAPNVGYTYLTINGESYGLHLNIETQDRDSLEKQFGPFQVPPQHLYEGEPGADATPGKWQNLEVKEGEEADRSDLEGLETAVGETSPGFERRVAPHADVEEMTRDWMVEKYTGHWDGYSGSGAPNNYYLYSDTDGVFQMMPSGTDQTWQSGRRLSFDGQGGQLFEDCKYETNGCLQTYRAAGEEALHRLTALGLDTVARCAAAAVLPWREYEEEESEPEKLPPYDLEMSAGELRIAREFIVARPAELAAYLDEDPPPKEIGKPRCQPLRPVGGFVPPSGPPTPPPSESTPPRSDATGSTSPASPGLSFGRRSARTNSLSAAVDVPAPGRVSLLGTFATAGRRAVACRGGRAIRVAGVREVACRYTPAFLAGLAKGPARVRLDATFAATGAAPLKSSTTLRVARR